MLWRISFVIDNGYEHMKRVCIVVASNESEANSVFKKWIYPSLRCDEYIIEDETTVELINCSNGIVYQNVFKY